MKKQIKILLALLFLCSPLKEADAGAFEFGGVAGFSLPYLNISQDLYSKSSFLTGAEATFGLTDTLRIGGFWDYNTLTTKAGLTAALGGSSTSTSGPLHFYGLVVRFFLPVENLFTDVKLGLNQRSVGAPPPASNTAPGLGLALGYKIPLFKSLSISPRIEYRSLTYRIKDVGDYSNQSIDFNALISYQF